MRRNVSASYFLQIASYKHHIILNDGVKQKLEQTAEKQRWWYGVQSRLEKFILVGKNNLKGTKKADFQSNNVIHLMSMPHFNEGVAASISTSH